MGGTDDKQRLRAAAFVAVSLHIAVIAMAGRHSPAPQPKAASIIAVRLIVETPPIDPAPPDLSVRDIQTRVADPLAMASTPTTKPFEPVETGPNAATSSPRETAPPAPSIRRIPDAAPPTVTFDPRWTLNGTPPTKGEPLIVAGLTQALDCSKGFDVECAALRKEVFADQQLSETDKVWMPSYASSGLSDPRFKDMSEAQIRAALAIPTANENGWTIPFSTVGISSYWTDLLYGVNKRCKAVVGKNSGSGHGSRGLGETELVQNCPELRMARRDAPLWRTEVWAPGGEDPDPAEWLKKKKPEP